MRVDFIFSSLESCFPYPRSLLWEFEMLIVKLVEFPKYSPVLRSIQLRGCRGWLLSLVPKVAQVQWLFMFLVHVFLQQGKCRLCFIWNTNHKQQNDTLITQNRCRGVITYGLSSDVPSANLGQSIAVLCEAFRCFPKVYRWVPEQYCKLGHDRFPPYFQYVLNWLL